MHLTLPLFLWHPLNLPLNFFSQTWINAKLLWTGIVTYISWCSDCTPWPKTIVVYEKWASTRENLSSGVAKKHRRRPACSSAQSHQRLCFFAFGKYHIQTCYKRNFNFLDTLCSWAGWFESHFVGNRVTTQMIVILGTLVPLTAGLANAFAIQFDRIH